MSDGPLLPPAVAALAEAALGAAVSELAPTVGGFSNLSRHARIGGRPCVIKAAELPAKRASLRHEAAVLQLLGGRGVPAPARLALAEDATWTVLITAALPGRPGVAVLEGERAELPAAFAALGAILAGLHALPAPALPGLALAPRLAAARTALAGPDLDAGLCRPLEAALGHPAWQDGPPRLLHGDAGLHNLLWDGRRAALLDWEWAAGGPPAFDLAWLRWTISWRRLPDELWQAALGAYSRRQAAGGRRQESDLYSRRQAAGGRRQESDLDALALGQIAMILARLAGQPAARAEWLRRAHWTLDRLGV